MIRHFFNMLPNQEKRIRRAFHHKKGCQIKVRKGGDANKELLVTPEHLVRFNKAHHGAIVTLPFKHEHLKENHKGGFLPILAAALAPVIGGTSVVNDWCLFVYPIYMSDRECGCGNKL